VVVVAYVSGTIGGALGCGSVTSSSHPMDAAPMPDARDTAPVLDGGDAGPADARDAAPITDGAVDPRPDAATPTRSFDVGYINELSFPFNFTGVSEFMIIVNRGPAALNLATAALDAIEDDSPDVVWTLAVDMLSTTSLPAGHAGGLLSQEANIALVVSGLVSEPLADNTLNFRISFSEFPPVGTDIHAQATLRIDDASVVLPFTIHVTASGTVTLDHAARVGSR